jgi:hypothetical protein
MCLAIFVDLNSKTDAIRDAFIDAGLVAAKDRSQDVKVITET